MKILNVFFYLALCIIVNAQHDQTRDITFIDKYGVTIILDAHLKLNKPIDVEFLIANINSKLIQPGLDCLTQFRILEITKTRRRAYRVKIAYLFFNSEKRMINHRNTYYRLIVTRSRSRYLLHEFQYEQMEF